eukprot:scaffold34518_cov30-Tisochrysis_lutea.AAC.5
MDGGGGDGSGGEEGKKIFLKMRCVSLWGPSLATSPTGRSFGRLASLVARALSLVALVFAFT